MKDKDNLDLILENTKPYFLRLFPQYFYKTINLWFDKIKNIIPKDDLIYFIIHCGDSIELWLDFVMDNMNIFFLHNFPIYRSDSIELWLDKFLEKLDSEHVFYLTYFAEHCKGTENIWEEKVNKKRKELLNQ